MGPQEGWLVSAECHKWNYYKCSKAVSLRMGDTVLVQVTTFKGRHKIQSRWENREYMVEWQTYPNVPVYLVHPICGDTTAIPYTEITCCPLAIMWNRKNVKIMWRELDLVVNSLQYHMWRMHCLLTTQPRVDQKAHLIHHQSSTNHLT